jgi:hypothetical protein
VLNGDPDPTPRCTYKARAPFCCHESLSAWCSIARNAIEVRTDTLPALKSNCLISRSGLRVQGTGMWKRLASSKLNHALQNLSNCVPAHLQLSRARTGSRVYGTGVDLRVQLALKRPLDLQVVVLQHRHMQPSPRPEHLLDRACQASGVREGGSDTLASSRLGPSLNHT